MRMKTVTAICLAGVVALTGCAAMEERRWDGCAIAGTMLLGLAMFSAAVRSPTVVRRQWLMFGTSTPKRRSRNSSSEV